MTMKFYLDSHLSQVIATQLRNKDIDCIHCADVGKQNAEDADHLAYATEKGYVMVSCDTDFYTLHARYQAEEKEHAGIIYLVMPGECENIGLVVTRLKHFHDTLDYRTEVYNQIIHRSYPRRLRHHKGMKIRVAPN